MDNNVIAEINLLDLCKCVLIKWKWIILSIIIVTLIAGGFWFYSSAKAENKEVTQEEIDLARSLLSEDKAANVEYLYAQYLSYVKYRKSIQDYMSDSLYEDNDYVDNIVKTKLYFVDSEIDDVNQVFARLALGTDEYEQIASVLNKSSVLMDDIYRRVSVGDIQSSDGDQMNIILENDNDSEQKKHLLQLTIVAENKDQANEITDIVEASFDKQLEKLRKVDPKITITEINSKFSNNISAFINARQNNAITYLNTINDQIASFQNNYIEKLETNQKNYYNLLKTRDELKESPIIKPSLIKYLVIGFLMGFILAFGYFVIKYLFDGKVKTDGELPLLVGNYNVDTIKRIGSKTFASIKCNNTFLDEGESLDMISSDLNIRFKRDGYKSAYLIYDKKDGLQREIGAELVRKIQKCNDGTDIASGDPTSGAKDLESFAASDAAIIITELKNSYRKDIRRRVQLCKKYSIPVIETVSVENV